MYQNILEKAQGEKEKAAQKKSPAKILRIAIPAAACLCIAVWGITHTNFFGSSPAASLTEDLGVQGANPFLEVSSAEEFKKIGIDIEAPEGAENISYAIISGNIASISYDKDGDSYTFRASEQSGDFSGIYGEVISSEPLDSESGAVLTVQRGGGVDYLKTLNERFAQSIDYIRQYPFDVAKVEGTRIFKVGDIVMYITAGAAYEGDDKEEEAKLAEAEYEKIDNAMKELLGSVPKNLAEMLTGSGLILILD